jgi:hypothetical protein
MNRARIDRHGRKLPAWRLSIMIGSRYRVGVRLGAHPGAGALQLGAVAR